MKKIFLLVVVYLFATLYLNGQDCPESFYDFSANDIYGNELNMSFFFGKKLLVVNTASECGLTNQYADLQNLYESYGGNSNPYNFEIIGFPANNFMGQEPGTNEEIIDFCETNYGITFTMMSKISVKGSDIHEIYEWLTQESRNCVQDASVSWNFQKFLINTDGSWHDTKAPSVNPMHQDIINWITEPTDIANAICSSKPKINIAQRNNLLNMEINNIIPQEISINIWSITGQLVQSVYRGSINNGFNESISLSNISGGIYILEITGETISENKKIMIY